MRLSAAGGRHGAGAGAHRVRVQRWRVRQERQTAAERLRSVLAKVGSWHRGAAPTPDCWGQVWTSADRVGPFGGTTTTIAQKAAQDLNESSFETIARFVLAPPAHESTLPAAVVGCGVAGGDRGTLLAALQTFLEAVRSRRSLSPVG